jgi:hypothetical protein
VTVLPGILRNRVRLLLAPAVAALLLPVAAGAEWITNSTSLDPGTCGRNLQVGSDRTASTSATPTFLLQGDGGMSSYAIAIDGSAIGTFDSTGDAVVCIRLSAPLADGPHMLTGTELAPREGSTRLAFSVDTSVPAAPTKPRLAPSTDSGRIGDSVTTYASIRLTGKAGPNQPLQIMRNGVTTIGGAKTGPTGRWTVTTVPLPPGTYSLTAITLDTAGNRSTASRALRVTIARR